jgi:hypothetical protein
MSIFDFFNRIIADYEVSISEPYRLNFGWAYVFARNEHVELRVFKNQKEASDHYSATKMTLSLGSFILVRKIPAELAQTMKFDDVTRF